MFVPPTRQEINLRILDHLRDLVLEYPDFRFGQLLVVYGLLEFSEPRYPVDPFYEESIDTLERLKAKIAWEKLLSCPKIKD